MTTVATAATTGAGAWTWKGSPGLRPGGTTTFIDWPSGIWTAIVSPPLAFMFTVTVSGAGAATVCAVGSATPWVAGGDADAHHDARAVGDARHDPRHKRGTADARAIHRR